MVILVRTSDTYHTHSHLTQISSKHSPIYVIVLDCVFFLNNRHEILQDFHISELFLNVKYEQPFDKW